jgi:hypothetical protein
MALMAEQANASTSLAEMTEEEAPKFALMQDYGDEYGEEAEEAEPAEEDGEGEEDAEDDAEEGDEESKPFDPLLPGGGLWHWINWSHTLLFGIYTPLGQRLRSYDCFSESMSLADELLNLRWAFQGMDFGDLFTLIMFLATAIIDLWGGVRWVGVCKDEYAFSAGNPYRVANLAGSTSSFTDVDEGFDVGFDIVYILGILKDGAFSYFTFVMGGWSSVEWIHYTARGITRLVMFIDKLGVGVIKPTKPWSRYLK